MVYVFLVVIIILLVVLVKQVGKLIRRIDLQTDQLAYSYSLIHKVLHRTNDSTNSGNKDTAPASQGSVFIPSIDDERAESKGYKDDYYE